MAISIPVVLGRKDTANAGQRRRKISIRVQEKVQRERAWSLDDSMAEQGKGKKGKEKKEKKRCQSRMALR